MESVGQDNCAEVPEDAKYEDNQENESLCDESDDPPSDFFDDFFREEFMEGLDVSDSWDDEVDECVEKNKEEESNSSHRNAGSKIYDGAVIFHSTSIQDSQKADSSGKKDDKNVPTGKSTEKKESLQCEKGEESLGHDDYLQSIKRRCLELKKMMDERAEKRRLKERNSEKRVSRHILRVRSPESNVDSEQSVESSSDAYCSRRKDSKNKQEDGYKSGRFLHREKSYEVKSSRSIPDDGYKKEISQGWKNSESSTSRNSLMEAGRRKADSKDPQAPGKNWNGREAVFDLGSKRVVDNTSGDIKKALTNDPTKIKDKLKVSTCSHPSMTIKLVENSSQKEAVAEIHFPKQVALVALNHPASPGTSKDCMLAETIPDVEPEITAMSGNESPSVVKWEEEDSISCKKNVKARDSKNTDKIKSRSPSVKSRQKCSKSENTDRTRKKRWERDLKRNLAINRQLEKLNRYKIEKDEHQRSHSRNRKFSSRDLERTRRSRSNDLKIDSPRGRSKERRRKGDRSCDHVRYPKASKNLSRPLSPEVHKRLSTPSLSPEPRPVSSARKRSLSRERYRSRRRNRRLRHDSLSSDLSLSLSSDSEHERSRRHYKKSPRKIKKKPFLKELADIFAAESYKKPFYQMSQSANPGRQQNAPNFEMAPQTGNYAPNLNDGHVLPMSYHPSDGSAPAKSFPVEAFPGYLPGNSMPMHPFPPAEGVPPTDFASTLHPYHPGMPVGVSTIPPVPAPGPGGEIMHHPLLGQPLQVMNSPGIPPSLTYASEASQGINSISVPESSLSSVDRDQPPPTTPTAPPPPSVPEMSEHVGKRASLDSVLEASLKVGRQPIEEHKAIFQRCEQAILLLKATEQLLMGSCITFTTALRSSGQDHQPNAAHARHSILNEKNVSFSATCHPKSNEPKFTSKKNVLSTLLSQLSDKVSTISAPLKPVKCERCWEQSKKTFADFSMQTNAVALCSVATQSDYQPCSETDLHMLNEMPNAFRDERVIIISSDDDSNLHSVKKEEQSLDNNRPHAGVHSHHRKLKWDTHRGGNIVPESHTPAITNAIVEYIRSQYSVNSENTHD